MISVITITFNNFEELAKTIKSLHGQKNIESIVINGGSCEKTKTFLQQHPEIISLSEKDNGISDAFNKGLRLAKGDSILFLNSGDILVDPNYLTQAEELLQKKPEIDFVYSDVIYVDQHIGAHLVQARALYRHLSKGLPFCHQTLIMRKSAYDQIGFFRLDLKVTMDFDLYLKMFKIGMKGLHIPSATIEMDGTGVSSKINYRSIDEIESLLNEHDLMNAWYSLRLKISRFIIWSKLISTDYKIPILLRIIKKISRKI